MQKSQKKWNVIKEATNYHKSENEIKSTFNSNNKEILDKKLI